MSLGPDTTERSRSQSTNRTSWHTDAEVLTVWQRMGNPGIEASEVAVEAYKRWLIEQISTLPKWEMEWGCDLGGEWQTVLNRDAILALLDGELR